MSDQVPDEASNELLPADVQEVLVDALLLYADPNFYHGCMFLFDRPTGGFDEDFSQDEDTAALDYDRPMPGKAAREALQKMRELLEKRTKA